MLQRNNNGIWIIPNRALDELIELSDTQISKSNRIEFNRISSIDSNRLFFTIFRCFFEFCSIDRTVRMGSANPCKIRFDSIRWARKVLEFYWSTTHQRFLDIQIFYIIGIFCFLYLFCIYEFDFKSANQKRSLKSLF